MNSIRGRSTVVKLAIVIVFSLSFAAIWLLSNKQRANASAAGPSPSHTNAPGEDNCTSCHVTFPVNSGTGNIQISGIPHDYLPGRQVNVTVTLNQTDAVIYGFQLTAIDSLGRRAGTLSPPSQSPPQVQLTNGNVGGNARQYIQHTVSGLIPTVFGTKSWTFAWTAPALRVGKVSVYVAGNASNSDGGTSGDYIYTKSTASLSGSAISNFGSDFQSDLAIFRPSNGGWYSYDLATGAVKIATWGLAQDKIAPGDYDGDGTTDLAVFRPSTGAWYILNSTQGFGAATWGLNGDIPAPGDYDGDGKTDIAVYRPSNGTWYILKSTGGFSIGMWGIAEDKPTQADFDADGKTDIAVFRPSTGVWYVLRSSGGFTAVGFGVTGDKPVQADYDGDGRADLAIYRPSTGTWWLSRSTLGVTALPFGLAADTPAPADFDGDGKTDIAVFRPSSGAWYITRSSDGALAAGTWGLSGDRPVPNGYIPE